MGRRRGDHNRLGFALQLTTARYLGTFLADPLDVPRAVIDYLSGQLEVADPSCVKRYTERAKTRFEHMWEIRDRYQLREFAEAEAALVAWVDARCWTTGDGPMAVFADAVVWLRERNVLLPGVFGLLQLLGFEYRPALADIPDQWLWRGDYRASYGPLDVAARGKLDLDKIVRHWPDIVRVVGSTHTGAVRAYDVVRMLQRDGHPTPLGEAIAHYGQIFKSLHVLAFIDDEAYRRDIKGIRNLQEGRHDLAQKRRRIFHGRKGELYQRYHAGMEDQLGALGLVLNCVVLWNTVYIDAALEQLRAAGHPVADDDVARLSPFMRNHLNVLGAYSFSLPDMPGGLRELRDPDTLDEEDD